jgi:hypothetical protein
MTSSAPNKASWKWQHQRRNIALVKVDYYRFNREGQPRMISEHARGVLKVRHMGAFHVGKTDRSEYYRALKQAERAVIELNNAAPLAEGDLLMSYGSA